VESLEAVLAESLDVAQKISIHFGEIVAEAGSEHIQPLAGRRLGADRYLSNDLKVLYKVLGAGLD
jgi:hypothetical protein